MRAAALWLCAALLRREKLFLDRGFDATCRDGIADTTLSFCCHKDCGECSNGSPVCKAKAKNGRGSTCCPEDMAGQPSCEASFSPCLIPAHVRATTAAAELKTQGNDRTAIHDCNKAIPDQAARNLIATHFVHFDRTAPDSSTNTRGCGTRTWEQAATKCDQEDWCVGMTADDQGDFDCFLVAGDEVTELDIDVTSTYLKSRGSAGQSFHFKTGIWTPDDACLAFCTPSEHHVPGFGEGAVAIETGEAGEEGQEVEAAEVASDSNLTRTVECRSSSGVTMPLGMCSLSVAMNADAYPHTETHCDCAKAMPYMLTHSETTEEISVVEECSGTDTVDLNVTNWLTNEAGWCFAPNAGPEFANMKLINTLNNDCSMTSVFEDPDGMWSMMSGQDLGTGFEVVGNIQSSQYSNMQDVVPPGVFSVPVLAGQFTIDVTGLPWMPDPSQPYSMQSQFQDAPMLQLGPGPVDEVVPMLMYAEGMWVACDKLDQYMAMTGMLLKKKKKK